MSVDDAVVPPRCVGAVIDVTVGVAEYAGATPTPPDTNTEPVATSANLERAVVVEA